ncbi:hypothetical protein HNQ68_002018 [Pseudochrobactrum saccharolyticum]|uniref:Invasion associated locus B family protein n=1 Tax=Pseudochrobactrum saccharolyticum TaxID=354352 RepID=A0A7W8AJE7_9HYPH|nr:hypothetical protein [Pseudochrobactrum saccharolyticum]MBB5091477.1 hypothetical protein [Pseudochrobactrum saccharolyticum]
MLSTFSVIILWTLYFSVPKPPEPEMCSAEDGDHALSEKQIEAWTLQTAQCSCFISLKGTEQSEFSMVVVKATPDQKQPRLSAMLSVVQEFPENTGRYPVFINDREIKAEVMPLAGTLTVELNGEADWIKLISTAKKLQIGPYYFKSALPEAAMHELIACYKSLSGKIPH